MHRIDLTTARLDRLRHQPLVVADQPTIHEIEGTGAATCLQGLLSVDVIAPGPGSLCYGALLTAKGMIVADYWVVRGEDRFVLVTERAAREPSVAAFRRLLPPRLARLTDRTDHWEARWLIGADWPARIEAAFGVRPAPGRAVTLEGGPDPLWLAAAPTPERAPFRYLLVGSSTRCQAADDRLTAAGVGSAEAADLRAARVMAGVPTLGSDIDDKTLPQEADFDALGGVSYQKGCYVGQETVARLHFRGHPNWVLRGLRFGPGGPIPEVIESEGKPVVRIGTVVALEDGTGIGLGRVRREFEPGARFQAADRVVTIEALPLDSAPLDAPGTAHRGDEKRQGPDA